MRKATILCVVHWCCFLCYVLYVSFESGFHWQGVVKFFISNHGYAKNGGQCHYFHPTKYSSQVQGFEMCVLMVGRPG